MRLDITEATSTLQAALVKLGHEQSEAEIIADHLMDCELRGLDYAGFARLLSIADRLGQKGSAKGTIRVLRETGASARLDGAGKLGYLVARRATEIVMEKALENGIAVVAASDTWYTGMLSYYAEQAVAKDLVVMIASNASPWVAPHGGTEGRFGTNPICFGFPSAEHPVIWDIGTSSIIHAQVVLARRLGHKLEPGMAFGPDGKPTTEPEQALKGAFTPWGGHRGSGLAIVVQLLGMLAGSSMMPGELEGFGFLIVAVRPNILTSLEDFKKEVAAYSRAIRETRPETEGVAVRMPFDRSREMREKRRAGGTIDVPDQIVGAVRAIAERA